jgi:lysophospholipid acyltransferase (LPLAT)-like uncharacterized protein
MKNLGIKLKIGNKILPIIINLYLKLIFKKISNQPKDFTKKIFVFWHKNMLVGWWLFKDRNPIALVSKSEDGEILSSILRKWNYQVTRGSSSKGGKEAVKELIEKTRTGNPVIITPDGPRGPLKEFKNGPLIVSLEGKYEIIPVNISYSKKIILTGSWDKFEIPLPFSKCKITYGSIFCYKEYLYEKDLLNFKKLICDQM